MDFSWNKEQKTAIDKARRFAEESLSHRSSAKGLDKEAWNLCARQAVLAYPLPESWGGLGKTTLESAAVFEALGRGGADRGLLFAMAAPWRFENLVRRLSMSGTGHLSPTVRVSRL